MWISKKKFMKLEADYEYLEKSHFASKECIYDCIDRIERIIKYAKDGEVTYVDGLRVIDLERLYYVYLNKNEYKISVPYKQKIYDIKKTKKDNVVIVMSRENTTDDDPVYCNFVIDLVSGDKVEIDLDDVKRYCSED